MPAPLIKIYQLPEGYTQDSDSDVQFATSDELIPVVPKLSLLSDVKLKTPLTPIVPVDQQDMPCFNFAGGRQTFALVVNPSRAGYYIATGQTWNTDILWEPFGVLQVKVFDGATELVKDFDFFVDEFGIRFDAGVTGTTCQVYMKAALGTQNTFALVGDTLYRGTNPAWNRLLLQKNGGAWEVGTLPADGVGYITVTGVTTGLKAIYAATKTKAKSFVGPHINWVGGHINQWPDVFVGLYDYPGDSGDVGGVPTNPGEMPKFREWGTYQLDFRTGMVTFPEEINSTATPVRANYAYASFISNVTGMTLDPVSGSSNLRYKADTETLFTAAHNKRWVMRNNQYMPLNVYVNGDLTPVPTSVANEVLTVKTS
jgi:hypothetical protein